MNVIRMRRARPLPAFGGVALLGALLAAIVLLTAAPRASATEAHCPNLRGYPGVIDWGINGVEQLGDGFYSAFEGTPRTVLGLSHVTHVRAGFRFGVALLGNCTLMAWGSNPQGQLGDGDEQAHAHPVAVQGISEVKEIAVANAHVMALLYNGTVWTWGASEFGQRGNKEKGWERNSRSEEWARPRDEPIQVPGLSGVMQIAAGGERDYALLSNGEVMAWGNDLQNGLGVREGSGEEELCYGELHAITPIQCSTVPRLVKTSSGAALGSVERISAGEETAFAVRKSATEVLAWGNNGKGQLGIGSTTNAASPTPVALEPSSPVIEIAAGSEQAFARLASGEVYAWGADEVGQLGFQAGAEPTEACGPRQCSTIPQPVYAAQHVVGLAAGETASFVLEEQEAGARLVYSFGSGGHYELLGLGALAPLQTATPTPIEGIPSVRQISASTSTALALLGSGPAPAPAVALTPQPGALGVTWRLAGTTYKLRDRPVGTRDFNPLIEGSCSGECTAELSGLRPEPYEVTVKVPEGQIEKPRRIIGTPLPAEGAPINVTAPTISGSPASETGKLRLGQTLTVSSGSWSPEAASYHYEWLRCEGFGEAGSAEELGQECEAAGSGESYEVAAKDVSRTLIARVRAENAVGYSVAVSSPELVLGAGEETEPLPPVSLSAPVLSGDGVEGSALTVQQGSWENTPTSIEDRWYRCKGHTAQGIGATCGPITVKNSSGQNEAVTGASYTPGEALLGEWVEVQEKGEDPGGWNVATSHAIQVTPPAVPESLTPPSIEGTLEEGQTLTALEGTWKNGSSKPQWQWLRCEASGGGCAAIEGATKQTYTIGPLDPGERLEVSETVENGVGRSAPASSAATEAVPAPPTSAPGSLSAPAITGTPQQGQTLSIQAGSWSNSPTSFTYVWKRCTESGGSCKAIAKATGATYVPVGEDVGHTIQLKETATNAAGSNSANSAVTAVITGAVPVASSPPQIAGVAQQGQQLLARHGSWSNQPTSYAYQWSRCGEGEAPCEAIAGATASTYTPAAGDVGATIEVQETASNATGAGAGAESAATAAVLPTAPEELSAPTITGTAQEGQTLTAQPGSWSGSPTSRSYRWMRCEGGECETIEGATGTSYVIGAADVGYSLTVTEIARNAGGWSEAGAQQTTPATTPAPTVSAVEPASGPAAGGTAVTITGTRMQEASAVSFGFAAASSYEILSPTQIRAIAPPGSAGAVDVTVSSAAGTSAVGAGDRFTYLAPPPPPAPPKVTALSAHNGPAAGGTSITVSGANFEDVTAVHFGANAAASYKVLSSSSLSAVAPAGTTGLVDVTVTTTGGTSATSTKDHFTYLNPVVSGLSPSSGPIAGGTLVTITGSGFAVAEGATQVKFGAQLATHVSCASSSRCTATAPAAKKASVVEVVVKVAGKASEKTAADAYQYR